MENSTQKQLKNLIEPHPLTPFLPPNAKVLMLGSFPPPRQNWKMEFYYPNYNNDMWRIFGHIFKQDAQYFLNPTQKCFKEMELRTFLADIGVAIYDVAYQVQRRTGNASDLYLDIVQPINLSAILAQIPQCQTLVTTGEKATQSLMALLGVTTAKPVIGSATSCEFNAHILQLYRMPSSSRAYPLPLVDKAAHYKKMFQQLGLI